MNGDSCTLSLRPGDWVRVRTVEEILATLDDHGELAGLPFMPEMLKFAGQRFLVLRRAESACASQEVTAIRRLRDTVHLAGLRCAGSSHGGCQSACLLFWKEAWLDRAFAPESTESNTSPTPTSPSGLLPVFEKWTVDPSGRSDHYRCQATQLWQATDRLPVWDLRQYLRQIQRNQQSTSKILHSVFRSVGQKIVRSSRQLLSPTPSKARTPQRHLNLQVGELVTVLPAEEIAATLDAQAKNRGMWFDPQMYQYCGHQFRVTAKIERMIEEGTGRLIQLQSPTVTLESIACDGCWHRFCSRESLLFWREIWLQRVETPVEGLSSKPTPTAPGSPHSAQAPVQARD